MFPISNHTLNTAMAISLTCLGLGMLEVIRSFVWINLHHLPRKERMEVYGLVIYWGIVALSLMIVPWFYR